MAESHPLGGPQDRFGITDVAADDLDPELLQRRGVRRLPGESAHAVTALDQLPANVGAGQPGGSGHQDGLAHERSAGSSMAEST